jgi:hypothetical protein
MDKPSPHYLTLALDQIGSHSMSSQLSIILKGNISNKPLHSGSLKP